MWSKYPVLCLVTGMTESHQYCSVAWPQRVHKLSSIFPLCDNSQNHDVLVQRTRNQTTHPTRQYRGWFISFS